MDYQEELLLFLKNTEGQLTAKWTDDSTPFSELAYTAEEYFDRNYIEGKIAALFIYQQLCIEILKQLINYSNFYEKLCVFPLKKEFKMFNPDASYSALLNELKFKVEFKNKKKLLKQIKIINDLRNKYGHELFSKWGKHDMDVDLNGLKEGFEDIFKTFLTCKSDLSDNISRAKKRPEIIELIKLIKNDAQ